MPRPTISRPPRRRAGRPAIPAADALVRTVALRLTAAEHAALEAIAEAEGGLVRPSAGEVARVLIREGLARRSAVR